VCLMILRVKDSFLITNIEQVRFAKMEVVGPKSNVKLIGTPMKFHQLHLPRSFAKLSRVTLSKCINVPLTNGKS